MYGISNLAVKEYNERDCNSGGNLGDLGVVMSDSIEDLVRKQIELCDRLDTIHLLTDAVSSTFACGDD